MKILLIDTDPETLFILSKSLSNRSFDVIQCQTFKEGSELNDKHEFNLVIADPYISDEGKEWVESLHESHPHIPLIMLTKKDSVEAIDLTLDYKIAYYCIKPFDLRELINKIQEIVSNQVVNTPEAEE